MKPVRIASLALALFAGSTLAASSADTIAARQANFKTMGKAMKASFDEMKTGNLTIATLRTSADAIATASIKVKGFFPKGTGPEAGVKTEALPVIWAKPDEFGADADKLVKAAGAFKAAADAGNVDAAKAMLMGVGGACKGCHETFKAKDHA